MYIQRGCREAALFDYRLQITDWWEGFGGLV